MIKELELNEGLYFLEILLNLLDDCTLDDEIEEEIFKLKKMIYKKLYSKINFEDKEINDYELILRYHFK